MSPLEQLQAAAESNYWWALTPEITVAGMALMLLVLEITLPKKEHRFIPLFAVMALVGALVGVALNFKSNEVWSQQPLFAGLLQMNLQGQIARIFFLCSSLLVVFLGSVCLPRSKMPRVEFYHIVLVITAACMLLVQSNHFVMFFVALETLTIGLYILVSYFRNNPLTLEAGLKYLVLGSLSSGIMLFGIVLLYGAVGRVVDAQGVVHTGFEFPVLANFLQHNPTNFLAIIGTLLVLSGVAFKIGAFPFQVWVPDVYQGAPTPVTAFLAVSSKAAGFAVLLTLVDTVFFPLKSLLIPVLSAMAAATILYGNLSALKQRDAKRLMGLSGVSHAGFLLIGVTASLTVPWASTAVWFYLFTYMLASMAVFSVMAHLSGENDAVQDLDSYDQLAKGKPFLAAILAIGVGSLAGIPPLAGFMGKLLIFLAAFEAKLFGLLAFAVIGVVISIYYYFGWIKAAYFSSESTSASQPAATGTAPNFLGVAVMTFLALATLVLGFCQTPLTSWMMK